VASVSHKGQRPVATCEHASSTPRATHPQSAGKRGARGNHGSPKSSIPKTTTPEEPGADGMSPMVAFHDGLELGPLEVSTHIVSLEYEGAEGSGRAIDRRKLRAPKVRFLFKSHKISSSVTRIDKLQRRPMAFLAHVSGR
jgi:hypothetical protein